MKPKYFIFLCISVYVLSTQYSTATVRYVSKTGTSQPPYTSWQTAADSIQKCINICVSGDTVYVANGIYEEQVVMIPCLSLIGGGMDSCIVDTRGLTAAWPFISVSISDTCLLMGFKIIVSNNPVDEWGIGDSGSTGSLVKLNKITSSGIGIEINNLSANNYSNLVIYKNIMEDVGIGIDIFNSNAVIRKNIINVNFIEGRGINIGAFNNNYNPKIDSNYIETIGTGIDQSFGSRPTITNNTIIMMPAQWGIYLGQSDSANVTNNLIISKSGGEGINNFGVQFLNLCGNYIRKIGTGIKYPDYVTKNNVVTNANTGLVVSSNQTLPVFQYNNLWNNGINYSNFIPDTTNLSVDPMVVNDDSTQGEFDFHLQKYSPLIDAGDPLMIDKDSSRIDIGLYGGLYGEIYKYYDFAPRPPRNLSAVVDTNQILLKWNRNTESDTAYYRVYRDTVISFAIDSTKLISSPIDTFFIQLPPYSNSKYVYKITCVDNQGNESQPSEEIVVDITSVSMDDYPFTVNDYLLYQNYPNPFNPSTKIGYKLKERGYVKLYVYDIKGELVITLLNKEQNAGYYEVEFSSSGIQHPESGIKELASGVYIYQLMVKGENNIPVYSDIKKMIYLK